ncbi:MAG: hypothetical protein ACK5JO_14500 [Halodesulfovibrio sp.]
MEFWLHWTCTIIGAALQAASVVHLALRRTKRQRRNADSALLPFELEKGNTAETTSAYDRFRLAAGLGSCLLLAIPALLDSDHVMLTGQMLLALIFFTEHRYRPTVR